MAYFTAAASPSTARRQRLLTMVIIGALVLLVLAIMNSEIEDPEAPTKDSAVEVQFPESGDLDVRQARIGVDLTSSVVLESLFVDQVRIPEDQLQRVAPLNQAFFTPGPGTATGAMEAGRHCARATFYPTTGSPTETRSTAWCFNLH